MVYDPGDNFKLYLQGSPGAGLVHSGGGMTTVDTKLGSPKN